jgi:hypothetical protein
MGVFKRPAMIAAVIGAAGAIAAGMTIPSQAAATSGVRYEQTQTVAVSGGPNGTECYAVVLSAAVSDGGSAYASAMVSNSLTTACSGWLESSVNGGAWTDVSPEQTLPAVNGGVDYPVWYKTDNYYAGPGTSVRACIENPETGATPLCSKAVTLAAGSAAPADDGTPVYYAQHHEPANVSSNGGDELCSAWVSGSTSSKTSTTQANMVLEALGAVQTCTAWLETSSDNGQTWQQATPTYSTSSAAADEVEYAFSAPVADGTGELARACAEVNTEEMCSSAW